MDPHTSATDTTARRLLDTALRGDWVGGAVTAAAGLGTAVGLGLLAATLIKLDAPGDEVTVWQMICGGVALGVTAFGAGLGGSGEGSDDDGRYDASASAHVTPLLFSLVALGLMVRLFRSSTAAYPHVVPALVQAARVAVLTAVPAFVLAIVFRVGLDGVDIDEMSASDGSFGASRVGALFVTPLVVFTVLVLACLARRDWWPGWSARLHDWFAAPVRGFAALLWLLPVAGLIGFLLVLLPGGEDGVRAGDVFEEPFALIGVMLAVVGNLGLAVIGVGSFAPLGAHYDFDAAFVAEKGEEFRRIGFWTDGEPSLWATPVVTLAVLALAAYSVVRASAGRQAVTGNLLRHVGTMFLVWPIVIWALNARGEAEMSMKMGGDDEDFGFGSFSVDAAGSAGVGAEFWIYSVAITLVLALVLAKVFGTFDPAQVRDRVASLQQRIGAPGAASGAPAAPPVPAVPPAPPAPPQP